MNTSNLSKVSGVFRNLRLATMSPAAWRASAAAMSLILAVVAMPVSAAPNLGSLGTDMAGQTKNLATLAVYGIALVGIILGGVGLHKLTQSRKTQEGAGAGILMVVMGSLMVALPVVINVMTQSTVQSGASGLEDLGIE